MTSTNHQPSLTNKKITPEKVVEILAKHGTKITEDEAAKALEFLKFLAQLSLEQIFENDCEVPSAGLK